MLRATPTVSTCTLEHYTHTHRHMDMLRATPTVSTRTLKNVLAGRLISPASDSREQLLHQYITAIHRLTNLELVASVSEDKCASSSVASLASGSLMKRSACVCVCVCARARAYTHTDTHTHTHTHIRSALTQDTPVKAAKKCKSASKDESSSLPLKTGEVIELDRQQFKVGKYPTHTSHTYFPYIYSRPATVEGRQSVAAQGTMASLVFAF